MTRFVLLSDLHLSAPEAGDPGLLSDTPARLDQALAQLARLDAAPAFVVLAGDLTNLGDAASYALLRDKLAAVAAPLIPALGNHDLRAGYRAIFGGAGPLFSEQVIGGLHIITLDTLVEGQTSGALDAAQRNALAAALVARPGLPRLIVLHHPPRLGSEMTWETLDTASTAALAAVLEGEDVVALLAGHVHLDRVTMWKGWPVITTTGLHNGIDAIEPDGLALVEGAGFALCDWQGGALSVTFVPLVPGRRHLRTIPAEELRDFV